MQSKQTAKPKFNTGSAASVAPMSKMHTRIETHPGGARIVLLYDRL
jgi:hypothetical protein